MVTVGFRPSVSLAAVRSPRPSRASGCLSLIFIPGCSSWRRSYGDKVLRCRRMGPHPQCANLFHHLFTQLTVAPPGLLAVGLRRQPERPTEVDRYGTQPGDPFPARQDVVGALHVYGDHRTAGACRQKSNPPLRLQQSHPIPAVPLASAHGKGVKASDERPKQRGPEEFFLGEEVELSLHEGHANEQRVDVAHVIGSQNYAFRNGDLLLPYPAELEERHDPGKENLQCAVTHAHRPP